MDWTLVGMIVVALGAVAALFIDRKDHGESKPRRTGFRFPLHFRSRK